MVDHEDVPLTGSSNLNSKGYTAVNKSPDSDNKGFSAIGESDTVIPMEENSMRNYIGRYRL